MTPPTRSCSSTETLLTPPILLASQCGSSPPAATTLPTSLITIDYIADNAATHITHFENRGSSRANFKYTYALLSTENCYFQRHNTAPGPSTAQVIRTVDIDLATNHLPLIYRGAGYNLHDVLRFVDQCYFRGR